MRWLLVALGVFGIALAVAADLDFVESYVLRRRITDLEVAGALPAARAAVGALGGLLVLTGVFLPRLARLPAVRRLLSCAPCIRLTVLVLPVLLLLVIALFKARFGAAAPLYLIFVREDSVIEYSTAIAYLVAAPLSLSVSRVLWREREVAAALARAIYAALFVFVALEEISYGQRIFGFGTPEYFEQENVQREVTLHNIGGVAGLFLLLGPLVVGLFGAAGWLLRAARVHLPRRVAVLLTHLIPPWFTATWFLPSALYALNWILLDGGGGLIQEDQEVTEFLVAGGFLVFTIEGYLERRPAAKAEAVAG